MEARGWLLYDDSCEFCRRWVRAAAGVLRRRGVETAPLQAEWVREALGAPPDLLDDIRLLLPNGRRLHGADVYRYLLRRIWWAYPFYLISILPVLRRLFDRGYRTVASRRHCPAGPRGSAPRRARGERR